MACEARKCMGRSSGILAFLAVPLELTLPFDESVNELSTSETAMTSLFSFELAGPSEDSMSEVTF